MNTLEFYIAKKRHDINIRYRNKGILDKFRFILLWILLDACIIGTLASIIDTQYNKTTVTMVISNAYAEETAGVNESTVEEQGESQEVPAPKQTIEEMIRETFGDDAEEMLTIAKCESGMNPDRIGDQKIAYMQDGIQYGTSHGIFQVRYLPGRPEPSQLHDAEFNIKYAKQILDRQGKYAWRWCYENRVLVDNFQK